MRGFPKIRKGHYMFGWDWGPRLPDAGIWKAVELCPVQSARLTRSYISQEWNDDLSSVKISVKAKLEAVENGGLSKERDFTCAENEKYVLNISIVDPEGKTIIDKADASLTLLA